MQANEKQKGTKVDSWFKGLKYEFRKITWPTRENVIRQSLLVLVSSVSLGIIVASLDTIIQMGVKILVNFPK